MLNTVRLLLVVASVLLVSCAPAPPPVERTKPDPTREASYTQAVEQLTIMNRELESSLRKRRSQEAAAIVTKAQPLVNLLLAAPRPTLVATEAVSDFDDLYGRLLIANRQYGFARFQFQKNLARWRNWNPQTEETARRKSLAASAIAECDRLLAK
jgi:hypothetical protein